MSWLVWAGMVVVVALLIVGAVRQWQWRVHWRGVWLDLGWYRGESLVLFQVIVCEWGNNFFTFFMVHIARYSVTLCVDMESLMGGYSMVEEDAE